MKKLTSILGSVVFMIGSLCAAEEASLQFALPKAPIDPWRYESAMLNYFDSTAGKKFLNEMQLSEIHFQVVEAYRNQTPRRAEDVNQLFRAYFEVCQIDASAMQPMQECSAGLN